VLDRKEYEAREESVLAPYASKSSHSRGRRYPEKEHPLRTAFQRDRDRIIHSSAFRRLEYKTQVFVNHEGDYYRTRLTHTIEVAQIARSVARALALNEDLTETIALAHDIGHTPFGHSGEDALREMMKDHGGFEHNRQGLRVVEHLERRYPEFPGLNLSWEVREGIVKHRTRYDRPTHEQGGDEYENDKFPSLEAQIVEHADSIAYDAHDLDDGLAAGLITEEDLKHVELWKMMRGKVAQEFGAISQKEKRVQTIRFLINFIVTKLLENASRALREKDIKTLEDVRSCDSMIVSFDGETASVKEDLETFLLENVYEHYRVKRMMIKARMFVRKLFGAYTGSAGVQLPPDYKRRIAEEGTERVVCDYIAGMTDRYALNEYINLFFPFERKGFFFEHM